MYQTVKLLFANLCVIHDFFQSQEAFALFDRDRDGEINTEELGKVFIISLPFIIIYRIRNIYHLEVVDLIIDFSFIIMRRLQWNITQELLWVPKCLITSLPLNYIITYSIYTVILGFARSTGRYWLQKRIAQCSNNVQLLNLGKCQLFVWLTLKIRFLNTFGRVDTLTDQH